jgi:hypothetical protein
VVPQLVQEEVSEAVSVEEVLEHQEVVASVVASAIEAVFAEAQEAADLVAEVGLVTNLTVMGQVPLQMVHLQVPVDPEGKVDMGEAVLEGMMIEMVVDAQTTTDLVAVAATENRLVQDKVGAATEIVTEIAIAIHAKVGIAEMTTESDHTTEKPTTSKDTNDDTSKQIPAGTWVCLSKTLTLPKFSNSRAIYAPIRLTHFPCYARHHQQFHPEVFSVQSSFLMSFAHQPLPVINIGPLCRLNYTTSCKFRKLSVAQGTRPKKLLCLDQVLNLM